METCVDCLMETWNIVSTLKRSAIRERPVLVGAGDRIGRKDPFVALYRPAAVRQKFGLAKLIVAISRIATFLKFGRRRAVKSCHSSNFKEPGPFAASTTKLSCAAPRRRLQRLMGQHFRTDQAAIHTDSASARARNSFAPSPRHALPCMHASVAGFVAASLSSITRAFFVCEK